MIDVKRLSLTELEEWKAKARALDEAVEWLAGRIDNESLVTVNTILTGWMKSGKSARK